MNILIIILFSLVPNLSFSDWTCTHHAKVRTVNSWVIYSDPTEAKEKANQVGGQITGIKDVDGTIAYKVDYKNTLVADDLFSDNTDCQES